MISPNIQIIKIIRKTFNAANPDQTKTKSTYTGLDLEPSPQNPDLPRVFIRLGGKGNEGIELTLTCLP